MLCSSGTGQFQVKIEFAQVLKAPLPQISITTHTMIHGSKAVQSSPRVNSVLSMAFGAVIVAADSSLPRSAGDSQSSLGCQTFKNRMRQPMEISEAPISTIHGLI